MNKKKFFILLFVFFSFYIGATVIEDWDGTTTTGKLGHYDLTNVNGVPYNQYVGGRYCFGNFNAVNGNYQTTNTVTETIKSFECRFYVDAYQNNCYMMINNALLEGWFFSQSAGVSQNCLVYVHGLAYVSVFFADIATWYLWSCTFDGTYLKIYVDNTLVFTSVADTYNGVGNAKWFVGNYLSPSGPFNGRITDVQIADSVYSDFPMTDVSKTFTPTFTNTATFTTTPTFTVTPTVTKTPLLSGWTRLVEHAPFEPRVFSVSLNYDNKLWVISGGSDVYGNLIYYNDAWYTSNGVDWYAATRNAAFAPRFRSSGFVFNNKMWIVAGQTTGANGLNDIWSSTDGTIWTFEGYGAFGLRRGQCQNNMVYDGKMWIISGYLDAWGAVKPDVWYSSNGVDWSIATLNAEFGGRSGFAGWIYDGKMWIGGGAGSGPIINGDIWSTTNGAYWVKGDDTLNYNRQHNSIFSYHSLLWVLGGSRSDGGNWHDVKHSLDGTGWTFDTEGFGDRGCNSYEIFNDRIFLMAGSWSDNASNAGISGPYGTLSYNDVWASDLAESPTFTPTYTPTFTVTFTPTFTSTFSLTFTNTILLTATQTYTITPTATITLTKTPESYCNWGHSPSFTEVTAAAAFDLRVKLLSLNYAGKIWMIAGDGNKADAYKDVWYSVDGVDWTPATQNAAFGRRMLFTGQVFQNKMWVIAGSNNNDFGSGSRKDAWWSTDGVDWTPATQNAAFGPRSYLMSTIYNGKMWIAGGSAGGAPFKDVWSSPDGEVWTQTTADYGGNYLLSSNLSYFFTLNGKIWLIANGVEVWNSTDGATWIRQPDVPSTLNNLDGAGYIVYNNKIWVVAGLKAGGIGRQNTVYKSCDVATWYTDSTGQFTARNSFGLTTMGNGIFAIVAGATDALTDGSQEVWLGTCVDNSSCLPAKIKILPYPLPF